MKNDVMPNQPDSSVFSIFSNGEVVGTAYTKANALLFTAAPEMLALLKRLNWAFYVEGTTKALKAVMMETKDLIHKAEGGK